MGVKNLWDILESCRKTLPLYHLRNKRVCIDLSCWMVQLQNVNKSHASMKDKIYLKGLFHRLRALLALNCTLIFVTDGSIPAIKLATYRRRLNSGTEVNRDETNSHIVPSLRRNMGSEFSCMIKEAKVLGLALGIPCLDGIEEAEAQCALLNSESLCDGCFTSDSDVFLFGARTVYRDICLGEGGYVVCYEMADIESTLGFGRNSLIALALLLGSDYSQGVHRFGPESACQVVKSVGEEAILKKIALEGISFAKKSKNSRKQEQLLKCNGKENGSDHEMNTNGSEHGPQREFLQVIDAYLKPKCHSADSDAVHRALALLPFHRTEAQKICAQLFEWPPEKTDEYILPKIAERDLRRFANLRSTSSNLGIHLPLHEIPVKCPISEIIKHRKVQGKECFEVSWQEFDGLKSSIVPVELVKSACPEKIAEFEERKSQAKKQNHRKPMAKKSSNRITLAEIDKQLQHLLLDIEGGNSFQNASSSSCMTTAKTQTDATKPEKTQYMLLDTESESDKDNHNEAILCHQNARNSNKDNHNEAIICNQKAPSGAETIIDLLSPSPPIRAQKVSKCQQGNNGQRIDVIDLSD